MTYQADVWRHGLIETSSFPVPISLIFRLSEKDLLSASANEVCIS